MASLHYATYIAPPKPVVADSLAPGEDERRWSPTSATLVYGDRDAVLVDALLTADEGRELADWIAGSGRNLIAIFVTHGHGDHFFGAATVRERFPQARVVAAPAAVEHIRDQLSPRWLDAYWRLRFPGQLPEKLVTAEPLDDHTLDLEGERLVAVELGHTDTDATSALHVPSIGLVVAGDAVYNDVHLHLGESGDGGGQAWLAALDTIESLQPSAVVAGHKRDGTDDDPRIIDETRRYLRDFDAASQWSGNATDLYESMLALHPDRVNRGILWDSARAAKG